MGTAISPWIRFRSFGPELGLGPRDLRRMSIAMLAGAAVSMAGSPSLASTGGSSGDSNSGDSPGGESACQAGGACQPHDDGTTDVCNQDDECDCPSGSQQGGGGPDVGDGPSNPAPVTWDTGEKWETAQDLYVRLPGKDFTFFRQYSSAPNLIDGGAYESERLPAFVPGFQRPWASVSSFPQVGLGWSLGNLRGMTYQQFFTCGPEPEVCGVDEYGEDILSAVGEPIYNGAEGWLLRAGRKPRQISITGGTKYSGLGSTAGPGNQTLSIVSGSSTGGSNANCANCNSDPLPNGFATGSVVYSEPGVWDQQFDLINGFGWISRDEDVNGNLRVYWDDPMDGDQLPDVIYLNGEDESDSAAWVKLYWRTVVSRPTLVGAEVYRPTGVSTSVVTQSVQYYHLVEDGSALRVKHLEVAGGAFTGSWVVLKDPLSPLVDLVPSEDLGTEGDLVQVVRRIAVDPGESSTEWRSIITQYRYHDGNLVREDQGEAFDIRLDIEGLAHQLKSTFEPQQIEFMAQKRSAESAPDDGEVIAVATELLAVDDDGEAFSESSVSIPVIGVATKIIGYSAEVANISSPAQTDSPVLTEVLQSGDCGCGGGGSVSAVLLDFDRFDWQYGTVMLPGLTGMTTHTREFGLLSFDAWPSAATADRTHCFDLVNLERGSDKFPFLQHQATIEGDVATIPLVGRTWVTSNVYNETTHARTQIRSASSLDTGGYAPAISPGGPGLGTAPSRVTSSASGLVTKFDYDGENVGELIVGISSSTDEVRRTEFISDGNESRRRLIDIDTMYRVAGSSNPNDQETAQYSYGFELAGSAKLDWRGVTSERELASENGPGSASVTNWDFFDDRGQRIVSLDADGITTRFEHDPSTGQVVRITQNYDPTLVSSIPEIRLPTGTGTEPADPFGSLAANGDGTLVTEYEYDLMGRLVKVTRPGGVESWTVRRMAEDPARPGILYFQSVTLPHLVTASPRTFSSPARLRWLNAASKTTRSESWSVDPASAYDPDTDDFNFSTEMARSTVDHDVSGAVVASKQWWNIAEDLAYETFYSYDQLGRLEETVDGTGTKTTRQYDVMDRMTQVAVGTTVSSPLPIAKYYYDGDPASSPSSGVGNGNLTHVERFDGSNTRLTRMYYDFRDRLIATVADASPMSVTRYDDIDRAIESAVYPVPDTVPSVVDVRAAAITTLPHDGEIAFGQSGTLDRAWYTKASYSQRGLVYREEVAIVPSDSSPSFLAWNWWYDDDGHEIAAWAPNSPGTITEYDAHHRVVRSVLTDRGGDYDDELGTAGRFTEAISTGGDVVIEQTEYAYAAGSGVLNLVTSMMRHHAASLTGDPDDDEFITTYSGMVYDSALRPVGSVDFGTNKAAFGVTAAAAPDLTDYDTLSELLSASDVLFAWTEYDDRGRVGAVVGTQTGAEEIRTANVYDDLGRTAAVVENAVNAVVSWDDTEGRYTVSGLSTGNLDRDRVTSFVYDAAGSVVRRIAHLPDTGGEKIQETLYTYGTTVPGGSPGLTDSLVASGRLLQKVRYPDETTGEAVTATPYEVFYAYNRLGELRAVTDQNGTVRVLERDLQGRVKADIVETPGSYSVAGVTRDVDGSVLRLGYTYDGLGRLSRAASYEDDAGTYIRDDVVLGYTPLWQIETIAQQHDGAVTVTSPVVEYSYANAAPSNTATEYHTGNYSRLHEVIYPSDAGNTNPTVRYIYDDGTDSSSPTDSLISRISRILVDQLDQFDAPLHVDYPDINMRNLADYQRIGMGMTAKVTISPPSGDFQPVLDRTRNVNGTLADGGDTYPAYDRFGRLTNHMWVRDDFGVGVSGFANQPPILGIAHTYDRTSNRLTADDARPGAKLPSRNRGFTYDRLQRLIEEERSPLPGSFTSQHKSRAWNLDMLGNWTASTHDIDEDHSYDQTDGRTHNAANEIESNAVGGTNPNYDREIASTGAASRYHQHRYDHAGNMTDQRTATSVPFGTGLMGGLRMGYDAWNRLVTTEHVSLGGGTVLDVSAYTYNALGWRSSKVFDASKGAYDGVMEQKRVFLYDASWRIVEEHTDIDFNTSAGREWVGQHFWGLRYIDDLVAKRIDRDLTDDQAEWDSTGVTTWYMVTDSQFSVSAVLDGGKHLWERVEYDAYGNARHRPSGDVNGDGYYSYFGDLSGNFGGSIGDTGYHADWDLDFSGEVDSADFDILDTQGLRTTALPAGWVGDPSSDLGPDNSIGYAGYVHNAEREDYTVRFRVYVPELGRWRQRDPVRAASWPNLLQYVSSNPIRFFDRYGLWKLVFDDSIPPGMQTQVRSEVDKACKNVDDALNEIDNLSECVLANLGDDFDIVEKKLKQFKAECQSDRPVKMGQRPQYYRYAVTLVPLNKFGPGGMGPPGPDPNGGDIWFNNDMDGPNNRKGPGETGNTWREYSPPPEDIVFHELLHVIEVILNQPDFDSYNDENGNSKMPNNLFLQDLASKGLGGSQLGTAISKAKECCEE